LISARDCCFNLATEYKFIIIDAGEGDNMFCFLCRRFGRFEKKFTFEIAIITHPYKDNYGVAV
jgi:hypothetical protein